MTSIPKRGVRGIRDTIPPGFVLGRLGSAAGPAQLIPINGNFTSPGYVANTTIQVGGAAGGDLAGTYPNPKVVGIQTIPVSAVAPTDGQVLTYSLADLAAEWKALPTVHGIPNGGTTGQVLTKHSNTDYDVDWETPSAGGGSLASCFDDGTNFYVAMSDSFGNLITSGGLPIFVKEVFPINAVANAMPIAMIAASLRF